MSGGWTRSGSTGRWSTCRSCPLRTERCYGLSSSATTPKPARRWRPGCWSTGQPPRASSRRSCRATTSAYWMRCGWPRRPATTSTRRSWRWPVPDPSGFLRYERKLPPRRPVPLRLLDWREVYQSAGEELIRDQASRSAMTAARWATASRTGTTWSAPAPGSSPASRCTRRTTSRSSPAGSARPRARRRACWPSAAAQQLARAGHAVTVYERDDKLGGLMRYGIPDFKLEKEHIDKRLEQLAAEGVEFVTGCAAGVDVTARERRSRHHAVLLACGARAGRDRAATPGRAPDSARPG